MSAFFAKLIRNINLGTHTEQIRVQTLRSGWEDFVIERGATVRNCFPREFLHLASVAFPKPSRTISGDKHTSSKSNYSVNDISTRSSATLSPLWTQFFFIRTGNQEINFNIWGNEKWNRWDFLLIPVWLCLSHSFLCLLSALLLKEKQEKKKDLPNANEASTSHILREEMC